MSLCPSCGCQNSGDSELCPHHHCVVGDDWAASNRIYCDFFHRKQVAPRLSKQDRADDFWRAVPDPVVTFDAGGEA